VTAPPGEHTPKRRRQLARLDLLKRRVTVASALGFAAVFGLAAQHAVKHATRTASGSGATRATASTAPTTYFDEGSSDFSFGSEEGAQSVPQSQASSAPAPSSPPVAQSSVS
jgi:hypothetical protein